MGPEILQWALGAIATTATAVGAIKSVARRRPSRKETYEHVSLVHDAARCWCGRDAAVYAGGEMRYVCAKHAVAPVPQRPEPDTEPLEYCDHNNLAGQCRECYLNERYYQQQKQKRQVLANAATISDEEWEEMMEEEDEDGWEPLEGEVMYDVFPLRRHPVQRQQRHPQPRQVQRLAQSQYPQQTRRPAQRPQQTRQGQRHPQQRCTQPQHTQQPRQGQHHPQSQYPQQRRKTR